MSQDCKQALFPGRRQGPGLKSPNKLWWAKEITPDIHIAGRLTMRQIRYAEDGGFRSVLSLFQHDTEGRFGEEVLPRTQDISAVMTTTSKLHFGAILDTGNQKGWSPQDAVDKLDKIISTSDKLPVLIFSESSRSAAFVVLMYLAKRARQDPNFEARVDSARFYRIAAAMGMDFTSEFYKEIVRDITGEPVVQCPTLPDAEPKSWIEYWLAHPLYKNWFTAGQVLKSTLPVVEKAGFPAMVNARAGKIVNGNPGQEEVTLVNIKENTGTYGKEVKILRQSKERLEETRIDPEKSKLYVSTNSNINYESRNENEFGDDIGYNEDVESEYYRKFGNISYLHLPIVSVAPFTKEVYDGHRDRLLALGKQGPVLVHCAKARRAGFMTILAAAEQYNKDLNWALRKSYDLGYGVSKETNPVVYETFVNVLGTDSLDGSRK